MTHQEINIKLCEKLGWKDIYGTGKLIDYMWAPGHINSVQAHWQNGETFALELPNFFTPAHFLEIVEALRKDGWRVEITNKNNHKDWKCEFFKWLGELRPVLREYAFADDAPTAACLAAARVWGIEV